MVANVERMMYVGEKPWHGLGTKLDNPATAAEAIEAAGLGWQVQKEPIATKEGRLPIQGYYATMRSDNNAVLGIVGERYTVLQNKDAFSFFDAIVGVKEAIYHTAGSLGLGEKVWILAKLPKQIRVVKDDVIDKYLLLANSHDGTSTVQIMFTPIRVVCQNTLNAAIGTAGNIAKLRHTQSIGMKVNDVRESLGIISGYYQEFETLSQRMTKIQMNKKSLNDFYQKIGIVTKDEDDKMSTRAQNILDEVSYLFEHGKGNDMQGVKGTLWAAYNSVTEYADYVRVTRKEENRAKSLLYGSAAQLKQRAWDRAVSIVGK